MYKKSNGVTAAFQQADIKEKKGSSGKHNGVCGLLGLPVQQICRAGLSAGPSKHPPFINEGPGAINDSPLEFQQQQQRHK